MQAKLSVCIIVKNEEKLIEDCIKSVLPVAWEIIVLDTGSSDRTKETVINLRDSLPDASAELIFHETKWNDDYSQARNECLKYVRGNWILCIDADEVLTEKSQKNILAFLESQKYQNEAVAFTLKVIEPKSGSVFFVYKTVLFRAGFDIFFKRPLHEHIYRESGDLTIISASEYLSVYHLGDEKKSPEELKKKQEKYIFRLLKLIKNNPQDAYFYNYHLANAYANNEQYNNALKYYHEAYKSYKLENREIKNQFFANILLALIRTMIIDKKRYKDALPYIEELASVSPDFPETLYYQAYVSEYSGDYKDAVRIYELLLNNLMDKEPDKYNPLGISYSKEHIHIESLKELGRCYILSGQPKKAISCFDHAYVIRQNRDPEIMVLLAYYNLVIEPNLYKFLFYHSILLDEQDLDYFNNISSLEPGDIRYRKTLLVPLKSLEKSGFQWFRDELRLIRDKLSSLEKEILKIQVCIISKNNQETIEKVIESVAPISDELVILDLGSEDSTKEIALNYHARVLQSESREIFLLKNQIMEKYKDSDWVLFLNGDEFLSPDSRNNLNLFLREQPYKNQATAFLMQIINLQNNESHLEARLLKAGASIIFDQDEKVYSPDTKVLIVSTRLSIFSEQTVVK